MAPQGNLLHEPTAGSTTIGAQKCFHDFATSPLNTGEPPPLSYFRYICRELPDRDLTPLTERPFCVMPGSRTSYQVFFSVAVDSWHQSPLEFRSQ